MRFAITTALVLSVLAAPAHAAPTAAQLCASAMELASAKYAQCRLTAESKDAKAPNPAKRSEALGKCSQRLSDAFAKASLRYGGACVATEPSSAFDEYLRQCSDDTVAAVGGAALPDHAGDLASCNASLGTCNGSLTTCNGDLSACEDGLAACEALPAAPPLKTGQTTAYGTGSDGDVQTGIPHALVDNGDGTVTDTQTGLMWEKKSNDGSVHDKDDLYTWSGASYGTTNVMDGTVATTFLSQLNAGSGFAGHTDWRLPNVTELETIRNLETYSPASFPVFATPCPVGCTVLTCSCTSLNPYWSSTTYRATPSEAWLVGAFSGFTGAGDKLNQSFYARAVRGGS